MEKSKKIIIALIVLVVLIVGGILGANIVYKTSLEAVSKDSQEVTINIEEGSSSTQIAETLKANNLIKNEAIFKLYLKLNNKGTNFKAGTYTLNKNMTVQEITEKLETGTKNSESTINITFLEGKNMRNYAKVIAENTNNSEDEVFELQKDEEYLKELIDNYWFLTDDILDEQIYYALEGYLYPDTYNFTKDVTTKEIFKTMLDAMEKKLEPYKDKIEENGYSVHQLLTVASIAELEGRTKEDRKNVVSVFYNRLNQSIPLGSDVTTYYGIKTDMSERDLKMSEINQVNGYNTRPSSMAGKIPVSPIASINIDTFDVTINPITTDYLYFVSDKNGKLYFAETESEHNRNISNLKNSGLWFEYDN